MSLKYSEPLPIGWRPKDFHLPATNGKEYSLKDFESFQALLVVITCNHCPYAQASWPLVIGIAKKHPTLGVVAINPNDETAYPDDSFAEMKKRAHEWNIPFPYLRDQGQRVAKAYKAQCTPDPYLFRKTDKGFVLFYHGRINDNWQEPDKVTERNLDDAIQMVFNGMVAPEKQPPSMGCSIKWKKG